MPNRLNVKTQRTLFEKCFDLLSVISIIVIFLFIYLKWSSLLNNIPMRFDSDGGVSQWGSKKSILELPVFGVLAWIVFSLFEKFPHNINLRMYRSDDKDKETKYNRIIVNVIKNGIVFCLILANWKIIGEVR
ncbi:hypothetical protein [Peribacillus simplex]|uniref:hypothetical protein n=1 Tax=Peribacillus simplex TaxID=1478 RepID=UPI003D2D7A30